MWTVPPAEIDLASKRGFQKFEVLLQSSSELQAKLGKMTKDHPLTAEVLQGLISGGLMQGQLAGPIVSKPHGEGTVTHAGQVFIISETMVDPEASIIDHSNGSVISLPPFSSRDASNHALKGNAILQSRFSPEATLSNWVTKRKISINTSR